jgi:oxygen-independent coproporphyrinogen-3 oxidase
MTRLERMLHGSPYQGYAYAYPHKTAYRRLPEPIPLPDVWARERRDALFLYVHVPFCEMRCGFCNLFTQARPNPGLAARYLTALREEAEVVQANLGAARFARFAIGGGTPTFLDVSDLAKLFELAAQFGVWRGVPISVETSPATAEPDKLALLRQRGVTRVSIGVQSFVEAEVKAAGRPQHTADVVAALDNLQGADFPTLNIDLMYGLPRQTSESWRFSLEQALHYLPEELYLYPLYVRPLTGLDRTDREWPDQRLQLYREGRRLLLAQGYEQVSMRMFRRPGTGGDAGPVYCCQEDGMVGLGCGARSYTRGLHYSRAYAVAADGVGAILSDYVNRPAESFAVADYGARLGPDEQRRRYVLQSLLQCEGLDFRAYRGHFHGEALEELPELRELSPRGLAEERDERLCLTDAGLELSDTIGPWLYSATVRELMAAYEPR